MGAEVWMDLLPESGATADGKSRPEEYALLTATPCTDGGGAAEWVLETPMCATSGSLVVSPNARLSSCFTGLMEKLRLTESPFPSRGRGLNVLVVGLFSSKAATRDLTETLEASRKARWVEGRVCSSTCVVSASTDCSLLGRTGAATISGDADLGANVFAGSCPASSRRSA